MCQMVLAAAVPAADAAAAAAAATVMGPLPLLLVVVGLHHYSAVGSSTRPSRPSIGCEEECWCRCGRGSTNRKLKTKKYFVLDYNTI